MKTQIDEYVEVREDIKAINHRLKEVESRVVNLDGNVDSLARYVQTKDFYGRGRVLKCKKCSHIWKYKGDHDTASCPNCRKILNVEESVIQTEKVKIKEK